MKMMEKRIAPSVLSADFSRLSEDIQMIEDAGADMLHVDVMDGHFVPNLTIGPVVVERIRSCTKIPFDVHLMVENPDEYIGPFAKAGANLISVHFEAARHLNRTLHLIRSHECKAGVVLNPGSPVEWLEDCLGDVDYVLIMSVNPGFSGQKFLPLALRKVEKLKLLRGQTGLSYAIEIDGGIGLGNLKDAMVAGADWVVSGSSIFQSPNPPSMIHQMKQIMQEFFIV